MPTSSPQLTSNAALELCDSMFRATSEDLIGLECEWPVRTPDDALARPDMGRLQTLTGLQLPEAGRVTLEPGGQVELSTAPLTSVSAAITAVDRDETVIHSRLRDIGYEPEFIALDAVRTPRRLLDQPRYAAMESHFDARSAVGRWMMCNTASVRVNISNDPHDPFARWNVLNRLGPVLASMFSNSRAVDASGKAWACARLGVWLNLDPSRSRPVPCTGNPGRDWLEYALDAKVFFIKTQGSSSTAGVAVRRPFTFAEWMQQGHELGWPTLDDFASHLTTLFPPVRPRGWVELRVLDGLEPAHRTAAALTVATLCAAGVRDEVLARVPSSAHLWYAAARHGLAHPEIAAQARIVASLVRRHASEVTQSTAHLDTLLAFLDTHTDRLVAPGDNTWLPLPIALEGDPVPVAPCRGPAAVAADAAVAEPFWIG